jgi:DNA polymerase I-like protein with 3'-5' exonuclease and polymerase domains
MTSHTSTLIERPADVLPDPKDLSCMVSFDTETTDLFVDAGATTVVVSVAFCRKSTPDLIEGYAFAFDQGRADEKGFEPSYYVRGGLRADKDLGKLLGWLPGDEPPPGFWVDETGKVPTIRVDLDVWIAKRGSEHDLNLSMADWTFLNSWLHQCGKQVGLTGQNVKFDLHQVRNGTRDFRSGGVDLEPFIAWDTMLASARMWSTEPSGLKPTGARLFGQEEVAEARLLSTMLIVNKKLWGLRADDGPRYDLLPYWINVPYAKQDAILTLRLAQYQTWLLEDGEHPDVLPSHTERDVDLTRVLYRIEKRGLGPLDVARTERVAQALEARIAFLENQIRDAGIDPPTTPNARKYFFDKLGLKPWRGAEEHRQTTLEYNPKGDPKIRVIKEGTLNLDVLQRLADQDVKWAREFGELIRLQTANRMNYRGYLNLRGPDDRLRTNYRQSYVKTGRMSVERFQAQNIPRRDSVNLPAIPGMEHRGPLPHPRDLFLVKDGFKRITMDLAQAELRVAAKFSECPLMIEQIREGRDLHGEMTTRVFGLEPEDEGFKAHRYIAKRSVFGGIFGIGPKSFKDDVWKNASLDIPYQTAVQTVEGFRQSYPEIVAALYECESFAQQHGYIELVDKSRSWFHADRPWETRTAWSRKVQGSLAVFNADWLIATETITENVVPGGCLVLTVHDSISLEVPEDQVAWIQKACSDWVAEHFEKTFGIPGHVDWEVW